jgi:hypothetical protein
VHLVAADDAVLRNRLAELRVSELLSGDERQHDAVGPRKAELAALPIVTAVDEKRVALQEIGDLLGELARLLEGIQLVLQTSARI